MREIGIFAFCCGVTFAQIPPAFEVASVKAVSGGREEAVVQGGTSLQRLIRIAYNVEFDQISGPAWMETNYYEIIGNVPPGATKEQLPAMLQNLLAERFHVAFHRVKKDFSTYELTIANGGAKLRQSAPEVKPPTSPSQSKSRNTELDSNGCLVLPQGGPVRTATSQRAGVVCATFRRATVQELTQQLRMGLGSITGTATFSMGRLIDKTGIAGTYDFTLEYAGSIGPGGSLTPLLESPAPDVFTALEKQLGLKIEKGKVSLDVLVIDHADKTPTAN